VSIGGGPFPADSFLGPAAARFVEQHPKVNVQVIVGGWDELLRSLRNRQLDFFLAETSTLQRDPDLDVAALPSAHPLYMTARAGHPLTRRGKLALLDLFEWPFVAASRVPPRILEPMLAGHRAAARQGRSVLPFPSMLCNSTGPVKRIVECSDALTAAPLFCLAPELESGRVVLLHTEPWLRLQYGIVSMKGRPWTEAAQRLRDAVLDAEREASADERRLALRYAPARSRSTGARRRR
jgi:DNA-binding transcriptional LysR family regulator